MIRLRAVATVGLGVRRPRGAGAGCGAEPSAIGTAVLLEAAHCGRQLIEGVRVRWEKKADNYAALLHLAFAYRLFHAAAST